MLNFSLVTSSKDILFCRKIIYFSKIARQTNKPDESGLILAVAIPETNNVQKGPNPLGSALGGKSDSFGKVVVVYKLQQGALNKGRDTLTLSKSRRNKKKCALQAQMYYC